jgi:hypothetical protein
MSSLYLFRCDRCCATFSVEDPQEKRGLLTYREQLEANPCPVCHKGSVEYVGYVEVD